DKWKLQDPVDNYTLFLKEEGVLTDELEEQIKAEIKEEIQQNFDIAQNEPLVTASIETEINDVYAPFNQVIIEPKGETKEMRFIDAVQDALKQSMEKHPELIIMGQDIAEYGGAFKVTEGFV